MAVALRCEISKVKLFSLLGAVGRRCMLIFGSRISLDPKDYVPVPGSTPGWSNEWKIGKRPAEAHFSSNEFLQFLLL